MLPVAVGTNTSGSSVKLWPLVTVFMNEVVDVNSPPAVHDALIVTCPEKSATVMLTVFLLYM